MASQGRLFGTGELPPGFQYLEEFISAAEEADLVEHIRRVQFAAFEMHGVVARRRVAFFGATYHRSDAKLDRSDAGKAGTDSTQQEQTPPIPGFLLPLREKIAAWTGVNPDAFAMALINEYQPGAPIGWHRDAPQYDIISGLSLLSACRMKFRAYVSPGERPPAGERPTSAAILQRKTTHEIVLQPRSIYLIAGEARTAFEHSIPAVTAPRYSITFRTLRRSASERR